MNFSTSNHLAASVLVMMTLLVADSTKLNLSYRGTERTNQVESVAFRASGRLQDALAYRATGRIASATLYRGSEHGVG